jgi:ABC-type bacteriocin/lantibiotic exporter with double-glycine peptidase domain
MIRRSLPILIAVCFLCVPFLFAEEVWDWKPVWLDKGDCGPNALYVLMNLEGKKISLAEVKKHLPFDPVKGCSLEAMKTAADVFDLPVEVRFVKPGDVSRIPRPFILHGITSKEKNLGHFIVVVDFDVQKRNYTLIDPVRETYTVNPESSLLHNFSGYVLIPGSSENRFWNRLFDLSFMVTGITVFCLLVLGRRKMPFPPEKP